MVSCDEGKNEKKMGFEDTELRLGMPPNGGEKSKYGKRGFEDMMGVDLKLNLATKESTTGLKDSRCNDHSAKPPAKAQVVGWPPMASFRKNLMVVQKSAEETNDEKGMISETTSYAFVKVSVDGVPYMRKVDLKMYKTYKELSHALAKMFGYLGKCEDEAGSMDYVPTYQDKDGDWMLAGDVPWEMFVESCKRLRVMKGTEARGLAMEKCKGRS